MLWLVEHPTYLSRIDSVRTCSITSLILIDLLRTQPKDHIKAT